MAVSAGFRSGALQSVTDIETFVFAWSPSPISLFTITALRARFLNLARVADTSDPGSGDDGGMAGDTTGEASDGRPLVSPEHRSWWSSWNWIADLARLDLGVITPMMGGIVGLAYGGGMDSALSVLLVLTEFRLNIVLIRLRGTEALRTTRVLQVRAVIDFSGAIPFIHL
jgi:hypothetical protein